MAPALMVCWIEGGAVFFPFSVLPRRRRRATGPIAAANSILAEMMELGRLGRGGSGRYGASPIDRRVLRTAAGTLFGVLSLRHFGWSFYPFARGYRRIRRGEVFARPARAA